MGANRVCNGQITTFRFVLDDLFDEDGDRPQVW